MNLVIDIGNTVAKLAVFDNEDIVEIIRGSNHSLDCLPMLCNKYPIERIIIASVITLSNTIKRQLKKIEIPILELTYKLTYEFIDAQGRYWGGNISPGIYIRFKTLNACCDKLPLIEKGGDLPEFGYSTETAIRAGVIKGIEFEITGYIHLMQKKYPDLLVFLTGGDKFSFDTNLKSIIFADRFLVLKGLNRILNYNVKK